MSRIGLCLFLGSIACGLWSSVSSAQDDPVPPVEIRLDREAFRIGEEIRFRVVNHQSFEIESVDNLQFVIWNPERNQSSAHPGTTDGKSWTLGTEKSMEFSWTAALREGETPGMRWILIEYVRRDANAANEEKLETRSKAAHKFTLIAKGDGVSFADQPGMGATGLEPTPPAPEEGSGTTLWIASEDPAAPYSRTGIPKIQKVSTGTLHGLILDHDGNVWSWGTSSRGSLGYESSGEQKEPRRIPSLSGIKDVAAGMDFSLALKTDGTVLAWGSNASGQLGRGFADTEPKSNVKPLPVEGLTGIIAVAAGADHALALKFNGTVFAWGGNRFGQCGSPFIDPAPHQLRPIPIPGLSRVREIQAGRLFSLALQRTETDGPDLVLSWGINTRGELGCGWVDAAQDGDVPPAHPEPRAVLIPTRDGETKPVTLRAWKIAANPASHHAAALRRDGSVWTWGDNSFGQLGYRTLHTCNDRAEPVPGISGATAVGVGGTNFVFVRDGQVWRLGGSNGDVKTETHPTTGVTLTLPGTPVRLRGLIQVDSVHVLTSSIAAVSSSPSLLPVEPIYQSGFDVAAGRRDWSFPGYLEGNLGWGFDCDPEDRDGKDGAFSGENSLNYLAKVKRFLPKGQITTSPLFDTSGFPQAGLSFRCRRTVSNPDACVEQRYVQIARKDNGKTANIDLVNPETKAGDPCRADGIWHLHRIGLPVAKKVQLTFAVVVEKADDTTLGWFIDDVEIFGLNVESGAK